MLLSVPETVAHIHFITGLGSQGQNKEFEASLGYIVS